MATSTETFPKKYAKALLDAVTTLDEKNLKEIQGELEALSILSEEPAVGFFMHPGFHTEEKMAVLTDLFSKHKFHEETKQFLYTLLSLGHLQFIAAIAKHFSTALNEKNREMKIQVSSAFPLTKEEEEKIKSTFEKSIGKKVLLDVTLDRDLIGGVRAQVGGVIYDSSIQGHLTRLQKEFSL